MLRIIHHASQFVQGLGGGLGVLACLLMPNDEGNRRAAPTLAK